jgi:hypothetical protein
MKGESRWDERRSVTYCRHLEKTYTEASILSKAFFFFLLRLDVHDRWLLDIRPLQAFTTANQQFAECQRLCRAQKIGHSAKLLFAECRTRQRRTHGEPYLCRAQGTRQRKTLGKIYFCREPCARQRITLGKRSSGRNGS